ncbi:MAG: diguanylate cyclase [Dethiobacter sp.]|nr:diguanylate cyclase [Dethiobacter sp.]
MSDQLAKNQNGELLWPGAFDAITDGISIMDKSLTILKANQAMERFYVEAAPQVGKKCHEAYHQPEYPCHICSSSEAIHHKKTCSVIVPRVAGNGQRLWLELYSYPLLDGAGAVTGVVKFARDITDRIRKEEALKASEEKYRDILASIEEGYYETDLEGNVVFCNDAAARLLGYTRQEFLGMNYRQIYKDHRSAFKTYRQVFLSGKPDRGFILEMVQKDGSVGFGELSISLVKDREGNITGFRGVARDITERIHFQDKLRFLSLHDQLTGLYNRTFFEEELQRFSSGREHPVSIIAADLDDLKLTNDAHGHHEGDKLLKATAAVLKESLRSSDLLARVGGDEFAVILPRTDRETAECVAARIRENMELYNSKHVGLPLGISLGIATAQTKETPFKDVYKQADDMMYRDKLARSTKARGKTVQALLSTLAERDFATEGHAQRLDKYCRKIGERINLSSGQLSDLAILAQVHDLGKIGIKDSILFKKGLHTEKEREIMRSHAEKGYRIALSSADLSAVADLILKHHEWWDGGGYPLGLAGKEIPVECRILAMVDAYDAMTNDRPYSKARNKSEVLAELKKYAGSQFDPELTEIFVLILEEEG